MADGSRGAAVARGPTAASRQHHATTTHDVDLSDLARIVPHTTQLSTGLTVIAIELGAHHFDLLNYLVGAQPVE